MTMGQGVPMSTERLHMRCACGSAFSSYRSAKGDFVLRGTERVYERARPFRIDHMLLDFNIDHAGSRFNATAELELTRVDSEATSVTVDAVSFDLARVRWRPRAGRSKRNTARWRQANYTYDGEQLEIEVPRNATRADLQIKYSASPSRGMYFLEPDERVPDRPEQLWTQCQDEDARYIFPCHDKPHIRQTMDIRAKVRPGWFVLSNGELTSSRADQKRGLFHYRMRQAQPSYLFTLVAGEFAVLEDRVGKLPVTYYVPHGRESDGKRTFKRTPQMIRLFAKLTGVPYPWTKYAQVVVQDFIFGGMENTGATTMYDGILLDKRAAIDASSDDLIAHELAHQWFGDLVTCRDWSHAWLNEGFATFMEHVWREHHLGHDEYQHGLRSDLNAWLSEASSRYQRPVVCQDYESPIDILDRHLYEKGALFLHSLRMDLGTDVFWRGVSRYLVAHRDGVVETRDLQRALETESGRSLDQLFEQAVHRADFPRLNVQVRYGNGVLTVAIKQRLDSGAAPFALDIDLDVAHKKGQSELITRRLDRAQQTFAIPMKQRPRFVVVDPAMRVVGRVTTTAPGDMSRNQVANADTGHARALAAIALSKKDDPASIRALSDLLRKDANFWGARAAAARALGNIASPQAYRALRSAAGTKHPKVRRAAVSALGNFRTDAAAKLLAKAAHDDESLLVAAAACRALGRTRRPQVKDVLVALLDRPSWNDTLRAGALGGLANLRDETAASAIREQTRYGIPWRGRRAAIAALTEISDERKTRELLEDILGTGGPHLRVAAAKALCEFGDVKARAALGRQLEREQDGRVRRRIRETLRDLGAKGQGELKRLREELSTVHREHAELKARLSKLEARAEG